MPPGLITRNSAGQVTASMTKQLSQNVGSVVTNAQNGSVSISLPVGRQYFYTLAALVNSQRTQGKFPGVTLTQNTLSWNYNIPNGFAMNCMIYYGYY